MMIVIFSTCAVFPRFNDVEGIVFKLCLYVDRMDVRKSLSMLHAYSTCVYILSSGKLWQAINFCEYQEFDAVHVHCVMQNAADF